MDKVNQPINERLKTIREELNFNQLEFSKILEIRQSYYSEMETGKRPVSRKVVNKLRSEYEISTDWMYTGEGDKNIAKKDIKTDQKNVPSLSTFTKNPKRKDLIDFYLQMSEEQADFELSIEIENLKDEYNDYTNLLQVLHSLRPAPRLLEKFPLATQFIDYKLKSENDFDIIHGNIKKPSLRKAFKILHYIDTRTHIRQSLSKLISFMHRYAEMQMLSDYTEKNK